MQSTQNFLRMLSVNGPVGRTLMRRVQPVRMLSGSSTDASQDQQEQPKKKKKMSHAFFASWYLLIGAGFVRWYINKQNEKNAHNAQAKLNRRASAHGLDYAKKMSR